MNNEAKESFTPLPQGLLSLRKMMFDEKGVTKKKLLGALRITLWKACKTHFC
jgi:hypothetical protein